MHVCNAYLGCVDRLFLAVVAFLTANKVIQIQKIAWLEMKITVVQVRICDSRWNLLQEGSSKPTNPVPPRKSKDVQLQLHHNYLQALFLLALFQQT